MERKFIVIHHTVTPEDRTVEQIRQIHLGKGYHDVGYHYLIGIDPEDGVIKLMPGRPATEWGAHCIPQKSPYDKYNMNAIAIGIALIGDFSAESGNNPSPEMINELAYAIKKIAPRYKIPINRAGIIGHSQASFTECPGKNTMKLLYKKLEV